MTEKLRQSLSAAMDDEADAFELRRVLDELGRDAHLRSLWDRYHLIGSALRGDRLGVPAQLRERVWAALEDASQESPHDAIAEPELATVAASAAVTPPPSKVGRYTGLAVAASVAFAVVLGFNGLWSGNDLAAPGLAGNEPVIAPAAAPAGAFPEVTPRGDLQTEVSASDVQRAQAYMLHHTQQQALNQAGVMSFVKLATYEAP